ncbi:hypothetical protein [Kribbella sp. CA-293567]|uniref:hypothetical protein n=1 Tax=Kribbella sp. CA-293567 TaxID=3002436 RepID=UPI0022DD941C|nr:hypothetical protein [Kribbella sp. CA-293567]WBQ05637.1 hypothetical protein OX958_02285 [Kribbella sp. CA-293567]
MIIAVDADSADAVEAEHLLHGLLESATGPAVACTHVVPGGHLALSITATGFDQAALGHEVGSAIIRAGAAEPEVAGPSRLIRGAYVAAVETALGTAGRLVVFPGQENARGTLTAADLRAHCGIDQVEGLGGLSIEDTTLVDTRDYVRPVRRDGQVVLLVQPAAGGVLIPFEVEHQLKCCSNH